MIAHILNTALHEFMCDHIPYRHWECGCGNHTGSCTCNAGDVYLSQHMCDAIDSLTEFSLRHPIEA